MNIMDIKHIFTIKKDKSNRRTTICSAINSRKLVEFYYQGGFRVVEPFCLGVSLPSNNVDNESLLCYQVSGHSEFGDPVGWKLFRFSEISSLKVTNENFIGIRPGYDPDNLKMTTLHCCVSVATDEASKARATAEPAQNNRKESLSSNKHGEHAAPPQKHNERMKKFRISHSIFPQKQSKEAS